MVVRGNEWRGCEWVGVGHTEGGRWVGHLVVRAGGGAAWRHDGGKMAAR